MFTFDIEQTLGALIGNFELTNISKRNSTFVLFTKDGSICI